MKKFTITAHEVREVTFTVTAESLRAAKQLVANGEADGIPGPVIRGRSRRPRSTSRSASLA